MADFSIQLTVPDERLDEFLAALAHHFNDGQDPPQEYTPAQLRAGVKDEIKQTLIKWFREYRQFQRENDDPGIT